MPEISKENVIDKDGMVEARKETVQIAKRIFGEENIY
ncbi:MAG: hypothetical protein ACD_19C00182G0084 [uncultured bacterium]|nr:MAG: hypothetical protein ACD_19C00182G0084 [uncultured bacterium]